MTLFNKIFFTALLSSVLATSHADSSSADSFSITGDPVAIERMERMLSKLGGRKLLANTLSLYTVERVRHYKYGDGIVETVWRDLDHPGASIKLMHPELNLVYAWDRNEGWVSRDGVLRNLSKDEIHQKEVHWQRDLYTLFHQLALGERKLTLKVLKPNGFRVFDEDKKKIGEFHLTRSGELYQWQRFGSQKSETYIYGPYKSFGLMNFPDWSTTIDGHWRSYIVQVQPSFKPFRSHISMEKPDTDCSEVDWQGGAVNTNCHENKH